MHYLAMIAHLLTDY